MCMCPIRTFAYITNANIKMIQNGRMKRITKQQQQQSEEKKQFKNRLFALNCAHMLLLFSFENSAKLQIRLAATATATAPAPASNNMYTFENIGKYAEYVVKNK